MTVAKRLLPPAGPLCLDPAAAVTIPQVVHRIWFGPMLAFHLRNGAAFTQPPGWEVVEWREEHVEQLGVHKRIITDLIAARKYRSASDVFRIVVLERFGGLYVDSDAVPVADFTDALRGREVLLVRETRTSIGNTYLAGTAGHALFQYMLDDLPGRLTRAPGAPEFTTGPWWLTPTYFDFLDSGVTWPISPTKPFFPYSFMQLLGRGGNQALVRGEEPMPPGTLFVHHWSSERAKPGKRAGNWALDLREVR